MDDIDAIGALHDPLRRRLYAFVVAARGEVSRNQAAEACGVQRTLAAFHLDKLVDAGLLDVTYRRLTGRSGPGAGRPAKLYRRATAERTVSVPPRAYTVAAAVLAAAVETAGADRALQAAARRAGQGLGRAAAGEGLSLEEAFTRQGYEPYSAEGGETRLMNCPFHQLAEQFPPLICAMNAALCEGFLDGLGRGDVDVALDPRPGDCCVVLSKKEIA